MGSSLVALALSLAALALYVASALGLLFVVGRWVRPLSRKAASLLILLPLCFTGSAFLTGRIYAPADVLFATKPFDSVAANYGFEPPYNMFLADVVTMIIPWRRTVQAAVMHGEWPLWNPFMFGGDPLAASATPAAYHPVTLLSLLLPVGWGLTFSSAAIFFLAGAGLFLFVRDLDCREEAALVGAAGWMYCSFLVMFNQMPHGAAAGMLPWVYLGARRCCRAPGPRAVGLLTAAFVVVLFAGHPETAAHVVFLGLLYSAYELAVAHREKRLAAVASGLGAGVLALLLSAVYLLAFLDVAFQTVEYEFRNASFTHQDRSVELAQALPRLVPNVIPFFYGIAGREAVESPQWFLPASTAYCGSILLAPAALALWRSRWRGRWVILGIGLLGVLAGASAPGVADLLPYLPFLGMAINKRLVFAGGLAVAVLAALGIEEWLRGTTVRQRREDGRRLGALQLAVLASLAVAFALLWRSWRAAGLSADFLRHQGMLLLVPLALAGVLGFVRWKRHRLALALLLLLAAQRTLEMGSFCPTVEPRAFFPRIAPLNALPETGSSDRGSPFRFVAQGGLLTPNVATLYGLEDVRGYQAVSLKRRVQTDQLWSHRPWFGPNSVLRDSPFLDFLNVRFALVGRRQPPPPGWRVIARGRGGRLLENLEVLERAFVPRTVRLGGTRRRVLEELSKADDFGRLSWISDDRPGPPVTEDNGPGTVDVERDGTRYRLRADMEAPGWLVVSETAWEGWQARLEGEPIPLHYANHAYLALHLPAGRHQVELFYRPRSFVVGLAISLVTLGALLVWDVAVRRRRGGSP